jgi:hypothetical protein
MNGATEQTLSELLAEARRTNANMAALTNLVARSSSGGGGGLGGSVSSAAGAMAGLVTKITPVGMVMTALSAAGSLVSGTFNVLSSIVGKASEAVGAVVSGLIQFAQKTMEGNARMSDLFASFAKLPFFIGEVASFFASILKVSEQYLDVYRELTHVGASFSGNLMLMRDQSIRAHLTLGEFSNIVRKNSDIFSSMGGNVQAGINKFVELQNNLMQGAFRRQIMGLGFTFEEAAQTTMDYMRTQGTMSKQGLSDVNTVRQGVLSYAMELDMLSKTTGKQREQIQKELQDLQMEEVWQNFVAQLSPEEASRATAAVNAQLQYGGKEAARSLMLAFQGINVPINEATQSIDVATHGMLTTTNEQAMAAVKSGKSVNEIVMMVAQNNAMMGRSAQQFQRSIGGVAGMMSQSGSPLIMATGQMTLTARNFNDIMKGLNYANSQQGKQASGTAAQFAENEARLRELGNALNKVWNEIVNKFTPSIVGVGNSIIKLMESITGSAGFKQTINLVTDWILATFNELKATKSPKEFFDVLVKRAQGVFDEIQKIVTPMWEKDIKPKLIYWFESVVRFIEPYLAKALDSISDGINSWLFSLPGGKTVFGAEDPNKRRAVRDIMGDKTFVELTKAIEDLKSEQEKLRSEGKSTAGVDPQIKENQRKINEWLIKNTIKGDSTDPNAGQNRLLSNFGDFSKFLQEWGESQREKYGKYATGTLGVHGSLFNDFGKETPVTLHGNEAVVTPDQMAGVVNSSLNNNVGESLQRLNSLTAQLLVEMKENNRHTKNTLDATKSLSGNLYLP